jgi:hypothetical protein
MVDAPQSCVVESKSALFYVGINRKLRMFNFDIPTCELVLPKGVLEYCISALLLMLSRAFCKKKKFIFQFKGEQQPTAEWDGTSTWSDLKHSVFRSGLLWPAYGAE